MGNFLTWRSYAGGVLFAAIISVDASAQNATRIALDLGTLIGSEAGCGLTFDQRAIENFVESKVPEGDMEFMSTMNASARSAASDIEDFTPSQKTAHCAQVRRSAKANEFIK